MPCTCDFARLSKPIPGHDYAYDYDKFLAWGLLPINFELCDAISERTRGRKFCLCTPERVGRIIDTCGVTLIPPESFGSLLGALDAIEVDGVPDYTPEEDDSPYPIDGQFERLRSLIREAEFAGDWLICFGA